LLQNFIEISYNVFTFSHISAANFLENTFAVEAKQIQQTVVIGCGQRKALSSKGRGMVPRRRKLSPCSDVFPACLLI